MIGQLNNLPLPAVGEGRGESRLWRDPLNPLPSREGKIKESDQWIRSDPEIASARQLPRNDRMFFPFIVLPLRSSAASAVKSTAFIGTALFRIVGL